MYYYNYDPDYDDMVNRRLNLCSEINLFKDSVYVGFYRYETVVELLEEYHDKAVEKSKNLTWDTVVLYAIIEYKENHQNIVSTNLMLLDIPYGLYLTAVKRLYKTCRLFFVRGIKQYDYE